MRRPSIVLLVSAVGAVVLAPPWPAAAGGGGCHRDTAWSTQADGNVVELGKNCMNPSVLRAEPGPIRFVNVDPIAHNVFGEGWGTSSLAPGEEFSYLFEPGTYAFACSLHPSMVGAVVVGDGVGSGPVVELADASPAAASSDTGPGVSDRLGVGLAAGALAGATGAAATLYGLAARRRRPT